MKAGFYSINSLFHANSEAQATKAIPPPNWERQSAIAQFLHANNPAGRLGGDRQPGNSSVAAEVAKIKGVSSKESVQGNWNHIAKANKDLAKELSADVTKAKINRIAFLQGLHTRTTVYHRGVTARLHDL